jgi:N-acetylmuramic acid 6-phosphate etherase
VKEQETVHLAKLETELRNKRTADMDALPTSELMRVLNEENHVVADSIDSLVPKLAEFVDEIVKRIRGGGRIIYVGAGTSGRLGVLDASECPPTFGVSPDMVQGIIAGGTTALVSSIEGAEDSYEQGQLDIEKKQLTENDTVIGIAASGRTPYVIGAVDFARSKGCLTGGIANVSNSKLSQSVEFALEAVTGPEPLTGSTRMKAGSAQKFLLNMISTAVMVRSGKVYQNLMVDVKATNEKLRHRAVRIVQEATGATPEVCETALDYSNWHAKTAIVSILLEVAPEKAAELLEKSSGHLRAALNQHKH